jgi:hypothetical protein
MQTPKFLMIIGQALGLSCTLKHMVCRADFAVCRAGQQKTNTVSTLKQLFFLRGHFVTVNCITLTRIPNQSLTNGIQICSEVKTWINSVRSRPLGEISWAHSTLRVFPVQWIQDLHLGHCIVSLVPTVSAAEADTDDSFCTDEVAREPIAVLFLPRLVFFGGRGTSGTHVGTAAASCCPFISEAISTGDMCRGSKSVPESHRSFIICVCSSVARTHSMESTSPHVCLIIVQEHLHTLTKKAQKMPKPEERSHCCIFFCISDAFLHVASMLKHECYRFFFRNGSIALAYVRVKFGFLSTNFGLPTNGRTCWWCLELRYQHVLCNSIP